MKSKITFLVLFLAFFLNGIAQNNEPANATLITTTTSMRTVPSLASRTNLIPAEPLEGEPQDGRSSRNIVIPGKDPQVLNDFFTRNPNPLSQKISGRAPSNVFDVNNTVGPPSDPSLAVGLNHVVIIYNTGFIIYDKDGNDLTGPLNVTNIFSANGCCDLTISYDVAADRWIMTYLFIGNGIEIAVSDGPDPVTANWNVYSIPEINDYNKLSVWSDGYYVTDNTGAANKIYALERDEMLAGNASAQIIGFPLPGIETSGFYSPQAFNVSNDDMPATGGATIVFLQDDAWAGVSQDHLKLWTVDVDWTTPANSTISAAQTINTTPFISVFDSGNFSNLTQPGGGDIDALQSTIMNQAQFRKFATHNSAVFNFVVDTDATAGELAGIRWYEFRQDGDNMPWSLYQEGTYTAPDGKHAWMASMIMDSLGNIGMGYTAMSGPTTPTTERVSVYYTGRFANDPINTMTISEELIAAGNGNIPGFRYGDYSKIDVDPVDDKTFWFIDEYIHNGGKDVVGVFKIAPNLNNDVGVVSIDSPVSGTLTNSENITVTIFNYGISDASNFPVNYEIDGGGVVTEMFNGTIASASTVQYTFTATGDFSTVGQTYSIVSSTNMTGDEDNTNDATTTEVTHLQPNDIGVTAISAPTSGTDLTSAESITVTITNFGGATQTSFDVTYDLNGTMVTETVAGPLAGDSEMSYTFTQTGDFSAFGNYTLSATTSLAGDSDTSNDATTVTIIKTFCEPNADCTAGDGFQLFQLGTISNTSTCGTEGYSDFTSLSTDLEQDSTNDLTITSGYGNEFVRVWIDFNDDFMFTLDELVVDNYEIADGQGPGSYTETMDLVIPVGANLGQHLLRAKSNWNASVGDDACADATSGFAETEDYTVNIIDNTNSVDDNAFGGNSLIFAELDDNIFDITLNAPNYNETLELTVFNLVGQRLVYRKIDNIGGKYNYNLDMSYVAKGVYLIRIGNDKIGRVKKFIVK